MMAKSAPTIAVTGAAGSLAADILPGLRARGYEIVAIDNRRADTDHDCHWVLADITDRHTLPAALRGCEAVVHLAGIPLEAEWGALLHANIDGTQAVLDAARQAGVRRVVLASSIHAVGFVPVPDAGAVVPDTAFPRPDTLYGVSKVVMEALGSLYHDRYGMEVICLRIASRYARPAAERMLSTWLSPTDAVRLVHAALTVEQPGFRIVWGVSRNTRGYLSPAGGAAIGYVAKDNAEVHAATLFEEASVDPGLRASMWDRRFIGGSFCSPTPPAFEPPRQTTT